MYHLWALEIPIHFILLSNQPITSIPYTIPCANSDSYKYS